MASRSFEQASVSAIGTQLFQHRFPRSRPLDDDLPTIAEWRCNLTAISHSVNLYFVAYNSRICVYEPQFPTQELSEEPALTINTEPSISGLRGHISREQPHAINNIITSFLGEEEVLAVVRDDGDVDAYRIRHIYRAIEARAHPDSAFGSDAVDIRPFFQRNVGNGAWGLAIHSQARMIAVSSNNLEVTIFTFALVEQESIDSEDDLTPGEERVYHSAAGDKPPLDRRKNDTRIIRNGGANIPHIAFCNTGHDPTGEWLISTDISGVLRSWNVHTITQGGAVRATMQPNFLLYSDAVDVLNSGWTVMFLDPRSFCTTRSVQQALGIPSDESVFHGLAMWDLSKSIVRVEGTAPRFVPRRPLEVLDGDFANPAGSAQSKVQLELQAHNSGSSEGSGPDDNDMQIEPDSGEEDDENDDDDDDSDIDQTQMFNVEAATEQIAVAAAELMASLELRRTSVDYAAVGTDVDQAHTIAGQEHEDIDDEDQYDSDDSFGEGQRQEQSPASRRPSKMPQILFHSESSLCGNLPCPILHASVNAMYLFQPSARNTSHDHIPLVVLADCFNQDLPSSHMGLNNFERCNMHAQIPSLGVVVMATQKGRAAVMTLTQVDTEAPDGLAASGTSLKRVYGYRVDHILPFASQEAAGHRPMAPLHGIAVGPMQGTERLADEQKRWRLMLMYQDQSILSYEIGRARGDVFDITDVII